MVVTTNGFDRLSELKAFDDSKAGVKGLVDAGVIKIPRIFIDEPYALEDKSRSHCISELNIPVLDLDGIGKDWSSRADVVEKIGRACEEWGFFQVINHGLPQRLMDEMIDGIRGFHEQEVEVKEEFYSRDYTKKVLYNSNFNLFEAQSVNWRDTLTCIMAPNPPTADELPAVCRNTVMKYTEEVRKLGITITELLSEALGLKPSHLNEMGIAEGMFVPCHYYPPCPEPELTLGATAHADSGFLTILLQDQIGGLQVLYQNQWLDVKPVPGALIVNLGDMFQLISNGKFMSVKHRVLANSTAAPRISVACIFRTHFDSENATRVYGPIKELISQDNPPLYREATIKEFVAHKHKGDQAVSMLELLKL